MLRAPDLLGRLLESFVVAQLRPELPLLVYSPRIYYLRQQDGRRKIDIIVEFPGGRVIGIEVKAAASANRTDARHLMWLRDQLGDRMICGIVLHAGPHTFRIDDRIVAAPIAALCREDEIRWPRRVPAAHAWRVRICLHDDAERFARLARPLLDADPVRHTLALTVLERVRDGSFPAALLLTVHRRGVVAGAALRTAGRPVLVSAIPPACAAMVDAAAAEADPAPDGVAGPVDEACAYGAAVVARTGLPSRVAMRLRLFRLVALQAPAGVAGAARRAGPGDVELLAGWQSAFQHEAIRLPRPPEDPRSGLSAAIAGGAGILLWEAGGRPVAYASTGPPIAGMSRVGPVYTPPEHRGHGYGSAVTAATTAWALAVGARDVVLFTDLANPVSNAIYPRIGYRPVHDTMELTFG